MEELYGKCPKFRTPKFDKMAYATVQTKIRLLLKELSESGSTPLAIPLSI